MHIPADNSQDFVGIAVILKLRCFFTLFGKKLRETYVVSVSDIRASYIKSNQIKFINTKGPVGH